MIKEAEDRNQREMTQEDIRIRIKTAVFVAERNMVDIKVRLTRENN